MKCLSIRLGVILIGIVIFGCAGIRGKDWKFFNSTDFYQCYYYVSTSHPLYKSTVLNVWIKLEYTEKAITEYVKAYGQNYENLSYSLQEWEIDCKTKKYRTFTTNQYSAEGHVLNIKSIKSPFSKSYADSLVDVLCK